MTEISTSVHGSTVYALVVKNFSRATLRAGVNDVAASADDGSGMAERLKSMRREVAERIYRYARGSPSKDDDAATDAMDDQLDQWDTVWTKEGPHQWRAHLLDIIKQPAHASVQNKVNAVTVYHGAGRHAESDRLFIKGVADSLLAEDDSFIEELHFIVPSTLLGTDGVLMDTPGLGDVDACRAMQTARALERANAVVMLSTTGTRGNKADFDALAEHGVLERAAESILAGSGDGTELHFVYNVEKEGFKPKALPPEHTASILNKAVWERVAKEKGEINRAVKNALLSKAMENGEFAGRTWTRPVLREQIMAPLMESAASIFPTLHRAVWESEADATSPDLTRRSFEATGMPEPMLRIRNILSTSGEFTSRSLGPVKHQLQLLLNDKAKIRFQPLPDSGFPRRPPRPSPNWPRQSPQHWGSVWASAGQIVSGSSKSSCAMHPRWATPRWNLWPSPLRTISFV